MIHSFEHCDLSFLLINLLTFRVTGQLFQVANLEKRLNEVREMLYAYV